MISNIEDLYRYLIQTKTKLLANIIFSGSPGHQIVELDYFLRKLNCKEVSSDFPYLWVQRANPITSALAEIFGDNFRQYHLGMVANDHLSLLSSQLARMVPELGLDVGLSHLKNSIGSHSGVFVTMHGHEAFYNISNEAVIKAQANYVRLRHLSGDFNPWAAAMPCIEPDLADFFGGDIDRLATIHFRKNAGNNGSVISAIELYPTFEFLLDNGFTIIKVGTEPYPEEFRKYDIINYSESSFRSFRNDLAIQANAKLNIINASGLENISDIMGIPTVSFAGWHLTQSPYSLKTVRVPTLLFDPRRGRLLNFAEQILFFNTRQEWWEGDIFGWHFPFGQFEPRNPTGQEILEAVKEALDIKSDDYKLSSEQLRFNALEQNGCLAWSRSRISQFFLERFSNLL